MTMTVLSRVSVAGGDSGMLWRPQEVLCVYNLTTLRLAAKTVKINSLISNLAHCLWLSKRLPSLPQSVSSLGENANKEIPRLVGSISGRHDDIVTRVQTQPLIDTPVGQSS